MIRHGIYCIMLFSSAGYCQIPINTNGKAEYKEVVTLDSLSKDRIFTRSRDWVYKTYKSGKAVVQMADKEEGKIIGNGATQTLVYGKAINGGYLTYTLSIEAKDNQYQYTIDNIIYHLGKIAVYNSGLPVTQEAPVIAATLAKKKAREEWVKMMLQADNEFTLLIHSLKEAVTKETDF